MPTRMRRWESPHIDSLAYDRGGGCLHGGFEAIAVIRLTHANAKMFDKFGGVVDGFGPINSRVEIPSLPFRKSAVQRTGFALAKSAVGS